MTNPQNFSLNTRYTKLAFEHLKKGSIHVTDDYGAFSIPATSDSHSVLCAVLDGFSPSFEKVQIEHAQVKVDFELQQGAPFSANFPLSDRDGEVDAIFVLENDMLCADRACTQVLNRHIEKITTWPALQPGTWNLSIQSIKRAPLATFTVDSTQPVHLNVSAQDFSKAMETALASQDQVAVRLLVEETSALLEGAEVFLMSTDQADVAVSAWLNQKKPSTHSGAAITNSDGWAILPTPSIGSYFILGLADGRSVIGETFDVTSPGRYTLTDLRVPKPGRLDIAVELSERIKDDLPESIVSAINIAAIPNISCRWSQRRLVTAVKTETGFAIDSLPSGSWNVEIAILGPDRSASPIDNQTIDIYPATASNMIVTIDGDLLTGTVSRGEKPVAAELGFESEHPKDSFRNVETSSEGTFVVLLQDRDTVYEVRTKPLDGSGDSVQFFDLSDKEHLDIELPEGRIAGQVLDADGVGYAASVKATHITFSDSSKPRVLTSKTTAASDGTFSLDGLAAGSWRLEAKFNELTGRETVELQQREEVIVTLSDTRTVRGRVVDSSGNPVPGADLLIIPIPQQASGLPESESRRTDHEGVFSFETQRSGDAHFIMRAASGFGSISVRRQLEDNIEIRIAQPSGFFVATDLSRFSTLVAPDGSILPLNALQFVPDGDRIRMGPVATGSWKLISVSSPESFWQAWAFAGFNLPGPIVELVSGQTIDLDSL